MNSRFVLGLFVLLSLVLVPMVQAQEETVGDMTPSVTVNDQSILASRVLIEKVVSEGPGWLVVHAQADGKPGPVLGYSPVADGENHGVTVTIDAVNVTSTLYAMLHTDAGEVGIYEFPGPDGPVAVDGKVVTPPFNITPLVTVSDQEIQDNRVVIDAAALVGPGWLVVHADNGGQPGPVIGHSPLFPGENRHIVVTLDLSGVTETLFAMLHIDAGELGMYEFPGPDAPVSVEGQVVAPQFEVTGGLEME